MVSGSGLTWEEQTQARLLEAREKQKQAEIRCKEAGREADHWKEYADTLEKALELDRRERKVITSAPRALDIERLKKQSIRDSMIDIASINKGILIVVDATKILFTTGLFADKEHARNSIYSNLSHYKKQFHKIRPGVYRLVTAHQPSLPVT